MKQTALLLLLLSSAVHGQTTAWTSSGTANVSNCCSNGLERTPAVTEGPPVYITNTPAPKCEDGWTLVMDSAMRPMCAHELKEAR